MKKIFLIGAVAALAIMAGCASTDHKTASEQHYKAQAEFRAANPQKPILSIEAMDGQTLEIKGLKKLEVYAGAGGAAAQFTPYVERPSEALQVFNSVFGGLMPVLGASVQALGSIGLVKAAGGIAANGFAALSTTSTAGFNAVNSTAAAGFGANTSIASQIQAPAANVTNNIARSNGVNIGSGSARTTDRHDTTAIDNSQHNPVDASQQNPNNSVNSSNNPITTPSTVNP